MKEEIIPKIINKVFFLSHIKNDWWKKDFTRDVLFFGNLTWISFLIFLHAVRVEPYLFSYWYVVLCLIILSSICLIGFFVSYATWRDSKRLQTLHIKGC